MIAMYIERGGVGEMITVLDINIQSLVLHFNVLHSPSPPPSRTNVITDIGGFVSRLILINDLSI